MLGGQKSLHVLPRYPTNKLVMQEFYYHISIGLSRVLQRKKKEPWPILPLQIGLYMIKNLKVADTEGKEIKKFTFGNLDFNLYDPRYVCKENYAKVHFQWLGGTFYRPEEEMMKNCYNASKTRELVNFVGTS